MYTRAIQTEQNLIYALDGLRADVSAAVDKALDELVLWGQWPELRDDERARKAVCEQVANQAVKALCQSDNSARLPSEVRWLFVERHP